MAEYLVRAKIDLDTSRALEQISGLSRVIGSLDRQLRSIGSGRRFGLGNQVKSFRSLTQYQSLLTRSSQQLQKTLSGLHKEVSAGINVWENYRKLKPGLAAVNREAARGADIWHRYVKAGVVFTLFYRAVNAVEIGLSELVGTLKEGIVLSGQLTEIQSKMAMWGMLFGSNAKTFQDAFQKASVNMQAFQNELPTALSSMQDLTQGLDEFAQHGLIASEKNMHAIVNFIDLVSMVAKATGSSANQVRQEIQALYEGTDRAGNSVRLLLKNLGIDTKTFLKDLREGSTSLTQYIDQLKNTLVNASVEFASNKWHKAIEYMMVNASRLASVQERGTVNINLFAEALNKHATAILKNDKLTRMWSVAIQDLASAFDSLLTFADVLLEYLPAFVHVLVTGTGPLLKWVGAFVSLRLAIPMILSPLQKLKALFQVMATGGVIATLASSTSAWAIAIMSAVYAQEKLNALLGKMPDYKLFKQNETSAGTMFPGGNYTPEVLSIPLFSANGTVVGQGKEIEETSLVDQIKKQINDFVREYTYAVDKVKLPKGEGLLSKLLGTGARSKNKLKKAVEERVVQLQSMFKNLLQKHRFDLAEQMLPAVRESVELQITEIEKQISKVDSALYKASSVFEKRKLSVKKVSLVAQLRELKEYLKELPSAIPEAEFSQKLKALSDLFDEQVSRFGGDAQELADIAQAYGRTLDDMLKAAPSGMSAGLSQQVEAFREKLRGYVLKNKSAAQEVSEGWKNAYNNITDALADSILTGKSLISSFVSWGKQALAQLVAKGVVGSIAMVLGLPGAQAWAGHGGFGGFLSGGKSLITGLMNLPSLLGGGITKMGSFLMNFPSKVWSSIFGPSTAGDYTGWGAAMAGENELFTGAPSWLTGASGAGITAGLGTFLMEGLLGGNWGKAAVSGASSGLGALGGAALAPLLGATGPVGAIIGAIGGGLIGNIFGGSLFGDGTERTYLERAYRFKYDRDLGASYTYRTKRWDRGDPDWMDNLTQAEGKLADSFTETINNLVNSFSGITPELKDQISKIAIETSTYWGVETEKEFKKRTEQNVVKMSQDLIGPIIELFKKDFYGQISGLDLSLFTDDFKKTLSDGFTKALSQVDFSKIKTVDDLNKQLERLGKIVQGEKQLEAYVKKVKELDDQYKVATGILDKVHQQMLAVNEDWENQRQSLINMGVDLEKMPEFTEAWRKAIVSVSEELYGFAMALPDKINESWSKVSQEILKTDFGQNLVDLLNQALEGKIDLSTVGERWAGEVQETMRKSIMSEALSGLIDQVKGAYLAPLMQSFLGADFNLENIQKGFDQIAQMGPELAQAGQSIAEVFSYMQEHPEEGLKGFNWDEWQKQFGAVWENINELNAKREKSAQDQAQAIMNSAKGLDESAKSLSASARSLDASASAISAAAARVQAPPPVYVTLEAAPAVNGG